MAHESKILHAVVAAAAERDHVMDLEPVRGRAAVLLCIDEGALAAVAVPHRAADRDRGRDVAGRRAGVGVGD
jgi:hypothetical protein